MKKALYFVGLLALASCGAEAVESEPEVAQVNYGPIGDSISMIAQQTLLTNVAAAMQQGGPEHAIQFCNSNASGIMDSLSKAHNVQISRVSEKYRNPNNKASKEELSILKWLAAGNKDTLVNAGDQSVYYKTIKLGMPACMKCHGVEGEDIQPNTLSVLNELYPNDLARNYHMGEFRGAWKLTFSE